ncbi:MAG: cytochrome C biogenesis protein [Candidatus Cloacimonetes bacterium]|nr:cytochrome C biogenesis protein [Candidatus Cloacimonadota bacterium]
MLENLATALYGAPVIAALAALGWGILSVLLSPCHLSSLPLIIAYINRQDGIKPRQAFNISLAFSLGILVTMLIMAVISFTIGILLGPVELLLNIFVSLLLLLAGLYFLDLLPITGGIELIDKRLHKSPYWNGFYLGILLGIGLGACALAFMAPILSISISNISVRPVFSITLMLAFIIGHCGIIVAAGTFMETLKKYLRWNHTSRGTVYIRRISGILIIIAAIYNLIKNIL